MDLSRLIRSAQNQQAENATATQFDSAEFFIRRLDRKNARELKSSNFEN